MYAIKKGSLYVARLGSHNSYTSNPENIRLFATLEEAKRDKCGNEIIVIYRPSYERIVLREDENETK